MKTLITVVTVGLLLSSTAFAHEGGGGREREREYGRHGRDREEREYREYRREPEHRHFERSIWPAILLPFPFLFMR